MRLAAATRASSWRDKPAVAITLQLEGAGKRLFLLVRQPPRVAGNLFFPAATAQYHSAIVEMILPVTDSILRQSGCRCYYYGKL